MIGFILLNKPKGLSSNTAMQKVRRMLGVKKAGHTGTLDPLATGMLPICIGRATRLASYFLDEDKTYTARINLGMQTATGDVEGDCVMTKPVSGLSEAIIEKALTNFRGPIEQVPPMYSALKHQGKKLYDLARKGLEVERPAREITIYDLQCTGFTQETIDITVTCSKGTYIRVLGEDIAKALGTVGHLGALHRVSCAGFQSTQMHSLEEIETSPESFILSLDTALNWPQVDITQADFDELMMGHSIELKTDVHGLSLLKQGDDIVAFGEIENSQLNWRKFLV